ncbi:MAG: hypothetical protein EXR59_02155 [Dehalococcoidia bacterium]|nr:hypothetical protein [Dehalococcoidia bacterium]
MLSRRDRSWSAVAHFFIVPVMLLGIFTPYGLASVIPPIATIAVAIMVKNKSGYLSFQFIQAIIFQTITFVIFFLIATAEPLDVTFLLIATLVGIVAAISCIFGVNFKYPVLGSMVERSVR